MYSVTYETYAKTHPYCEVCLAGGVSRLAAKPHHIVTRGAGGSDEWENLISLCVEHHAEVHVIGRDTFAYKHPSVRWKFRAVSLPGG